MKTVITNGKNLNSILKVTKGVIQNSRNYHNYYLEQKDNLFSNQIPLITSSNLTHRSNILLKIPKNEEMRKIRREHIRSDQIPKLCPLYNEKGDLMSSVAISSKINIKNLNMSKSNLNENLANIPFIVSQRYYKIGKIGNAFNQFQRDVFWEKKYYNLKYNEKEIFGDKEKINKIIRERIEKLKNENNTDETNSFDENFVFWKNKKKMNLNIKSLSITFEDITNDEQKTQKKEIMLPFNLLPIFYINGDEIFKKILTSVIYFDNDFEKIELKKEGLYIFLRNNDTYLNEIENNIINEIESFEITTNNNNELDNLKRTDNEIYLTEPQVTNQIPLVKIEEEIIQSYKKSTYNIYPKNKKISNYLYYNIYQFIWSTPNKIYKITINLPLITFSIPSNSIRVQQFIDYELLFYLMENNFLNWDFYIIKYLSSFKRFRNLIENLASHSILNYIQIYLRNPKLQIFNYNNLELININTDKELINSILIFKPIYAYVTIINDNLKKIDKYIVHFNFSQMLKFIRIKNYLNKVLFFIKFLDIFYEDNIVSYNYEELDDFNLEKWVKDVQKFNLGGYFNLNEEKNNIKEFEFLGNIPNIKVKIELKEPKILLRQLYHGREEKKCYNVFDDIQIEISKEENFIKWSNIIPKAISKENEIVSEIVNLPILKKKVKNKQSLIDSNTQRVSSIYRRMSKKKEDTIKIKAKDVLQINNVKNAINNITIEEKE